jgi:ABC-type lipoprotein export system ATPase subunit
MLYADGLAFTYPNSKTIAYPTIHCDAKLPLLVEGKSGCGKSTLLHILAGLQSHYTGKISVNNVILSSLNNRELDKFRGKHIGIVFQKSFFIDSLSMKENMDLACFLGMGNKNEKKVNLFMQELNIAHDQKKLPSELSSGELQRFSIMRALINDAKLVLADEPTSSLDDENTELVTNLLLHYCKTREAALVIVTHDERLKKHFKNQIQLA